MHCTLHNSLCTADAGLRFSTRLDIELALAASSPQRGAWRVPRPPITLLLAPSFVPETRMAKGHCYITSKPATSSRPLFHPSTLPESP